MVDGGPDSEPSRKTAQQHGPGCLRVVRGPRVGLVYRIAQERMLIGRGDEADVAVTTEGVSRRHAELVRDPTGSVTLVDLESRNGTCVNGRLVAKVTLRDGDKIRIGEFEFDFRYERADDRATVDLAASTGAGRDVAVADRFVATMCNLAKVHMAEGRFRDALATYERGRIGLEARTAVDPGQLVATLIGAGRCQLRLKAPQDARPLLQRALDLLRGIRAPQRELAEVRLLLAGTFSAADDEAVALALLAQEGLDPGRLEDLDLLRDIEQLLAKTGRGTSR